jgi:hypothetical protein
MPKHSKWWAARRPSLDLARPFWMPAEISEDAEISSDPAASLGWPI